MADVHSRVPGPSTPGRAAAPQGDASLAAWSLPPFDRLVAGQKRALELAVGGAALSDVLGALILALEGIFDRQLVGAILLFDTDRLHLRHGAAPSLPESFTQALDGMAIDADGCTCAAAAFSRQPVIAEDIARDPAWEVYRHAAASHGLRSCWATPILASAGTVLGTFATYAAYPRVPTTGERDTVDLLSRTAALVIEREASQARAQLLSRLDDALRPLSEAGQVTETAAAVLGHAMKVDRCAFAVVNDDQDHFTLTGTYSNGGADTRRASTFSGFGSACLQAMRDDAPWVVVDSDADPRIEAALRSSYQQAHTRSLVWVPIHQAGRCVGALAVQARAPRDWQRQEVDLLRQVASRCWESMERSRLTRTLHEAVEREQRARSEAEAQKRRAESANRAKDEFLAMLGHELRNPLSPIRTALQLMKLRGNEEVTRERAVIERQVEHLTRLVDDLLDVSRIARGKVDLRRESVEMADVVGQAVEQVSPLLEERGQHLTIDLPGERLDVVGDATRLSQVLSNLLTNAAKYTDPGGHVEIGAQRVDDEIVVRVTDTGVGIAPEILPRIFELFVQARQESDRAHGGLGLGLAIVKSLVERHGGTITAESAGPGQGSSFEVRLPTGTMPLNATDAKDADSAVGAPRRVLVVDDNEDGAAMLAAVLSARGHLVAVAHDAPTALETAASFHPDVALLDIGLPVMDGNELAVKIRQIPGLADLRLVALTGYGQPGDKARSRAAGFDMHLVKPVDLAAIDGVLDRRDPAGH